MTNPKEQLQPIPPLERLREELAKKYPLKDVVDQEGQKVVVVDNLNFDENCGIRYANYAGHRPKIYVETTLPMVKTETVATESGKLEVLFVPASEENFSGKVCVSGLEVGSVVLVKTLPRSETKLMRRITGIEFEDFGLTDTQIFQVIDPLAETPRPERATAYDISGIIVGIA